MASQSWARHVLLAPDRPAIAGLDLEVDREVDRVELALLAEPVAHGFGIDDDRLDPLEHISRVHVKEAEPLGARGDEQRLPEGERRLLPDAVFGAFEGRQGLDISMLIELALGQDAGFRNFARPRRAHA